MLGDKLPIKKPKPAQFPSPGALAVTSTQAAKQAAFCYVRFRQPEQRQGC